MASYGTIVLYLLLAEVIRRVFLSVLSAYTGPLSKIPGPFLCKFSMLPWAYLNLTGDTMNVQHRWIKKYGPVVRIGPKEVLFGDKFAVQQILVEDDLIKSPVYEMARVKGNIASLIGIRDRTEYKKRRRQLSPGFAIGYLNGLEPLMQDCIQVCEETIDGMCAKAGGKATIDMLFLLGNLTSDVMAATSFGGSMNLVVSGDKHFRSLFWQRLVRIAVDVQFPFLKYLPFVPPAQVAEMDEMIDDIIAKRRAENAATGAPKKDIVQLLIDVQDEDPESFTQLQLREEMVLFMVAGSDTTSLTAVFTLLLLVHNPEKLKILEKELETAFPSKQSEHTFLNTQELPYLNAVIKESMRVLPIVVGGLSRYTTTTTMIGGYEIPPKTLVAAIIAAVQRDPLYWPDPEKFIPERWLAEYKGVEADRKAYHPFSAGTHNCIGQQFALKELRLIIAMLVRKYELSLVPGQNYELRVFTVPHFRQGFYNVGVKPKTL